MAITCGRRILKVSVGLVREVRLRITESSHWLPARKFISRSACE